MPHCKGPGDSVKGHPLHPRQALQRLLSPSDAHRVAQEPVDNHAAALPSASIEGRQILQDRIRCHKQVSELEHGRYTRNIV